MRFIKENDGVESEMDDEKKTKRKEKQAKRPKRAASPGVLENAETQEKKHEVSMVANEKGWLDDELVFVLAFDTLFRNSTLLNFAILRNSFK